MPLLKIKNSAKLIYLNNLTGKIFKILPLSEENNNTLPKIYIDGLMLDLDSANDLFEGILIELIIKVNSLRTPLLSHDIIRKIVFECTGLVDKIKEGVDSDG